MKKEITRNTNLIEILKRPNGEKILKKYKFPCLGCPFAKMEMENLKIGDICKMYGIDIKGLLKDLNNYREQEK